jgi:hypothetical protein
MRRLLTWALVTLGIAALVRKLRRRGHPPAGVAEEQATEDPADELRRKLAETREPDVSPPSPESSTPDASVEERRAQVHDHGRATLDEMHSSDEDE